MILKHKKKIIIFVILFLILVFFPTFTFKIRDDNFKVVNNSIAELTKVKIGGVDQCIMMRGVNEDNPIILFLHGGPGYPFISYARRFQSQLEQNFVVVNWDQRGSGKSYRANIDENSMNQEQLEQDTIELIDYLCDRFNKEKIYIVGHSWGTVLGIETIQNAPEKIIAYIGIGQVVDDIEGEKLSYDYVLEKATKENNQKALKELKEIGKPPYKNSKKDTFVQREWLKKYGGYELEVKTVHEIIKGVLLSPEYSWFDGVRFIRGNLFSIETLFVNREKADFREKYKEFDVPVYFCAGRYDYNTPSALVEEYYNIIKAPKKNFYWFENSAHEPHLAEEEKFAGIMMKIYEETK
ncbi:alpha/beta fold hydrolase [Abyssisolibacter fermentans]|uniref:alpha/beta fold hydrolase n=1 Tax=Abyssisolibacter fermentans TaxID=1766203 RepID=UPI000830079F|nr:alpha/beta hydrolase [Abyssisolibacter fermentans]